MVNMVNMINMANMANMVNMVNKEDANKIFNNLMNSDSGLSDENRKENDIDNETSDVCLITNLPLENNYITLNCKHKFNYISLYNEVVYQKTRRLLDNARLRVNEIKCPYCRTITQKLLPYYKYYGVEQIKGVNYPPILCMVVNRCEYITNKKMKCNSSACLTKYGY